VKLWVKSQHHKKKGKEGGKEGGREFKKESGTMAHTYNLSY
jgi:hypothetical protein